MKIVALLPVKNEAWVLPSYLSSVGKIADEIIALDDNSVDSSADILKAAGAKVITHDAKSERVVNMSARRQTLLEAGRAALGTHFIWLDADETFSSDFTASARDIISTLQPGQKLTMRWVHPWKSKKQYLDDETSPFGHIWKDFIVCDNQQIDFKDQFLSEARTPGEWGTPLILNEQQGVVIHWQFTDWGTVQLKQAWYRCTELIEGSRSARRINHSYSITLDRPDLKISLLPDVWLQDIVYPLESSDKSATYLEMINTYFQKYGIGYFEPLQIWHIPELRSLFIEKIGRNPIPKVFPRWIIILYKPVSYLHRKIREKV